MLIKMAFIILILAVNILQKWEELRKMSNKIIAVTLTALVFIMGYIAYNIFLMRLDNIVISQKELKLKERSVIAQERMAREITGPR